MSMILIFGFMSMVDLCAININVVNPTISNWFCNKTLWSTQITDSWSYSNCSFTSSNMYLASVLWLGDNYKESLKWRNYRVTILVSLIAGFDTGIIFRSQDANENINIGAGKKYILQILSSHILMFKCDNG
eukprot:454519_1